MIDRHEAGAGAREREVHEYVLGMVGEAEAYAVGMADAPREQRVGMALHPAPTFFIRPRGAATLDGGLVRAAPGVLPDEGREVHAAR